MKFMEKAKRFFTLSAKHEGFTLVELIVVIAILAILAGVAIPAYSGYIKKANEAADQTLLSAVNRAFASAAFENGVDAVTQPDGSFRITLTDGKVDTVSHFEKQFGFYYAGNEDSAFKTITALTFVDGVFVDVTKASATINYGGGTLYIPNTTVDALNDYTLVQKLGTEGTMQLVDNATTLVADGATMADIYTSQGFIDAAKAALGVDDLDESLTTLTQEYMDKTGETDATKAQNQVLANAAVLYAAQQTGSMSATDVQTLLTSGEASTTILSNINNTDNSGTGLAQAAVAYGMYTSFAEYTGNATAVENLKNGDKSAILGDLDNNAEFQAYLNSDQGQKDAAAYLSAMDVVSNSSQQQGAVESLMVNGYANAELVGQLQNILGK